MVKLTDLKLKIFNCKVLDIVIKVILSITVGVVMCYFFYSTYERNVFKTYPEQEYNFAKLIGEGGKNLTNAHVEDGKIITDGEDPRVSLELNEPIHIMNISLVYKELSEETSGFIFLNPSYYSENYHLTEGKHIIELSGDASNSEVSSFAIRLAWKPGVEIKLGETVINSKKLIEKYCLEHFPFAFVGTLCALIAITCFWFMYKRDTKNRVFYFLEILCSNFIFFMYLRNDVDTKVMLIVSILLLSTFISKLVGSMERDSSNTKCKYIDILVEYRGQVLYASCLSFLLFFYAPIELYVSNKYEFWYDFKLMFPNVLGMFALFLFFFLFNLICLKKMGEYIEGISKIGVTICFLLFYIQGTFLVKDLPKLDGTVFDWDACYAGKLYSMLLLILIIVALVLIFLIRGRDDLLKICTFVCSGISIMLVITLVTFTIQQGGFFRKNYFIATADNLMDYSKEQNFIVICLDAVDGTSFSSLMQSHENYYEDFKDFTFFPDTVGSYPFTSRAIPFLIGGNWYENEIDYEDWLDKTYEKSSILNSLNDENYEINIYTDYIPQGSLKNEKFYSEVIDNFSRQKVAIANFKEMMDYQIDVVAFRYMPYGLKHLFDYKYNEMANFKETDVDNPWEYQMSSKFFDDEVSKEDIVYKDNKQFKFVHLDGAHVPYNYSSTLDYDSLNSTSYNEEIEGNIYMVGKYIDYLKNKGVYDNSIIIICSDHGFWQDSIRRQVPLLMIKGVGENHEFKVSDAIVSFDDMQKIYQKLLQGDKTEDIFDSSYHKQRKRRFLYYNYGNEENITEYIIDGKASESDNMKKTGKVYNR